MSEIQDMHGRKVLVTTLPKEIRESYFCSDCGSSPEYLVTELKILPVKWNPREEYESLLSWFWCGTCDVGC
jgi:hypothetical protein